MRLIQSSIIIVSLTLLATCFAKNEASVRGLKKAKGSKLPTKSVKSFKSSKKAKAAKSDKTKTGKKSKTPKGKKGGSGSKSAKSTKSKSCKLKKSSKNFKIEGYNTYNNMTLKRTGLPSLLNPVVNNSVAFLGDWDSIWGDYVSICLEDAVVECSRRCAEEDGKCTTFEVTAVDDGRSINSPMHYCHLINNNVNEFNSRRIYPTSELSPVVTYVYNNKLAPPLKVDEMPKGLYPDNSASADFQTYGIPAVSCVGTQGLTNPNFNQALFKECATCFLSAASPYNSCISIVAGICGGVSLKGEKLNFFSDDTCGQACFAGKASNYACLSTLQTYVLAVEGQALINAPDLGPVFGCTTSNIFDPTTGEKIPDYTCPPNTNQPVPN